YPALPGACVRAGGGLAGPAGQRFGDSGRLAVPAVSGFLDDHRPVLRAVQLAGHAAPGRPWTPVRRDPTVGNDRLDGRWLAGLISDGLDRGEPQRRGLLRGVSDCHGAIDHRGPLLFDPAGYPAAGGGLLHGVGVGCFTVGGQVFLDSRAQTRQRASAQGLFLVLTSGLGSLLGNLMAGDLAGTHPDNDVLVFLIPCVINGAMLIYFLAGFRSHDSTVDRAGASTAELPPRPHSVRGTVGGVGNLVTEPADG